MALLTTPGDANGNPLLEHYNRTGEILPALRPVIDSVRQKLPDALGMSAAAPQTTLGPPVTEPPSLTGGAPTASPATVPVPAARGMNGPTHPLSGDFGAPGSWSAPGPAVSGAKQRYEALASSPSGVGQIKNPWARVPLQVLDAIGSAFLPSLTTGLPGTQLHHQMLVNAAGRNLTEEENASEKEARTVHELAETQNSRAVTPHTLQTAEGIMQWNPATQRFDIKAGEAPAKEETEGKTVTTDQGIMQWDPKTKTYRIKVGNAPEKEPEKTLQDADGVWYHIGQDNKATPITVNGQPFKGKAEAGKPKTLTEKWIADHPKGTAEELQQFLAKQEKKPQLSAEERGYMKAAGGDPDDEKTWTAEVMRKYVAAKQAPEHPLRQMVDVNGRAVEIQPGSAIPAGARTIQQVGSEETKEAEAKTVAKASLDYATSYLSSGRHTGPGDEALLEKFFDLAKPSTGFRMTRPQLEMLMHTRDLVQGLKARARHALTPDAPYFDDVQRQHIVDTMRDLARAKGIAEEAPPTPDEARRELERRRGKK